MADMNFKILIVDDDEAYRTLMVNRLEGVVELRLARSGREAWALLQREKVDAVFTDVKMPNGTGFELLEWIKGSEHLQTLPVVLVSGELMLTLEQGQARGAVTVLSKPLKFTDFLTVLDSIVKQKLGK